MLLDEIKKNDITTQSLANYILRSAQQKDIPVIVVLKGIQIEWNKTYIDPQVAAYIITHFENRSQDYNQNENVLNSVLSILNVLELAKANGNLSRLNIAALEDHDNITDLSNVDILRTFVAHILDLIKQEINVPSDNEAISTLKDLASNEYSVLSLCTMYDYPVKAKN